MRKAVRKVLERGDNHIHYECPPRDPSTSRTLPCTRGASEPNPAHQRGNRAGLTLPTYECFGLEEFGSARTQTLPLARVRVRAPRTRSSAKCAREPPFRARLVRLRVIVRRERARGGTRRQRRRMDAVAASSAHLVA